LCSSSARFGRNLFEPMGAQRADRPPALRGARTSLIGIASPLLKRSELDMNVDENAVLERHNRLLEELKPSGRLKLPVGGVRPLVVVNKKLTTADVPTRSLIVDGNGEPLAVLFVSTTVDVGYVARSLDTAAQAKRALGERLGSVILDPIAHGESAGCSFAIWPWHRTPTSARGFAYLQRRLFVPHVLEWLRGATERTAAEPASEELGKRYFESLTRISRDDRLPPPSQSLARAGLRRLESGSWRPRVVLQHKDILWNILLPRDRRHRKQFPWGFILIDWAGGTLRGYPFLNLLDLARNSRMSRAVLRAQLVQHCQALVCDPGDVMPYLLAAVGSTLANLGLFPEDMYRGLYARHLQYWLDAMRGVAQIESG
jgi:hypothetical protein